MRPTTLPSLCVFVALVLLSTEARPAHSALILPLIIFKKLPKHKLLVPVPLPLPLPIPIPLIKPKVLPLILPKLPRIGITLHLGKGSPLRHLRIHHKPKLVHLDHGHDDHDYHHSHSSHQPHHHHHGPPSHSGEDEVYEVKNQPPQYPSKDWKS
ncbi:uncharacterized protein LOC125947557 [Dermacentor silvarum]|uniref:uncharacterized protein LOC125947557 n=1 Tax=Dermacentor silvarum TaxID=543639 RepID=UPI002101B126|nr:uncharacterized protein LOC125947557 [Dermacentor silvarum]